MLINLRAIHKPTSLEEAASLLGRPGVYPLYGGGASLIRLDIPDVEEAVDLSLLVPHDNHVHDDGDLHLGAASTLENICAQLVETDAKLGGGCSAIIKAEVPETLRNALTLGDVLIEHNASSLLLTLLTGLHADFSVFDAFNKSHSQLRIRDWFGLSADERRQLIVTQVACRDYAEYRYAFEKLGRTPSDAAIVGAVAFAQPGDTASSAFSYVGGLTDHPVRYVEGMRGTISNYKGSEEYRAKMAQTLSERAIARAIAKR